MSTYSEKGSEEPCPRALYCAIYWADGETEPMMGVWRRGNQGGSGENRREQCQENEWRRVCQGGERSDATGKSY